MFIILSIFLVLCIFSLLFPLRETLTYDEIYYYRSGLAVLSTRPSERGAMVIDERNIMPASALNVLVSRCIPDSLKSRFLGDKILDEYDRVFFGKLATILVSLLLAFFVFTWANQLYGFRAGFLALILYVFDPNIIAHSRLVHQDLFGAFSVFVAIYYFWRLLNLGGIENTVLSLVSFGISQVTRFTSLYLFPIYILLTLIYYGPSFLIQIKKRAYSFAGVSISKFFMYAALLVVTTLLIINLGFFGEKTFTRFGEYKFESKAFNRLQSSSSVLRSMPVPIPYAYLLGLDFVRYKQESGFGSAPAYLMGKLGLENWKLKGFKEYYVIAFLYKVPLATQFLLILAIINLLRYRKRVSFRKNEAFLIIPSLFYFAIFSFSTAQLGIRYILMAFPLLFVLSGMAVIDWTKRSIKYRFLVTCLLVYLFISNLSYFPHYLSYFNELLIDRKYAYTILADSNLDWGQNESYLQEYLEKHPAAVLNPRKGDTGLAVIAANSLVGLWDPEEYRWVRENFKPIDHIAYSYLVFDIKNKDIQN